MPTRAERDLDRMMRGFQQLGPAIQRMKQERMAKELLGEPLESYQMRDMMQDDELVRELKRAQIARALREPAARGSSLVGEDGLTPYQRKRLELSLKREERLANGGSRGSNRGGATEDSFEQLDKDLRRKFGVQVEDLAPILEGKVAVKPIVKNGTPQVDSEGAPDGDGWVEFSTRAGVPMKLKKSELLPFANRGLSLYQRQMQGADPNASRLAEMTQGKPMAGDAMGEAVATARQQPKQVSPEKRRLAELALNDPEATEDEKAQARRILGL